MVRLISFIVTCYNLPADMVGECLDSILSLSLRDEEREIILVDDGSDTCTMNGLQRFKDSVTYVWQKNSGLSMARNAGLRMATGRYIQFVDGDDKLITSAYERCLDVVRYESPDMVMFRSTSGDKTHAPYNEPLCTDGTTYLRTHNMRAVAWGYVFKAGILGGLRFTPDIFHEDEEFTPQLLLRAGKVYDMDITAYFYRQRPRSITNSRDKRDMVKRLDDVEGIIKRLDNLADTLPEDKREALKRRVAQLTMDYIYDTMKLTKSSNHTEKRVQRLVDEHLFPLPENRYTLKYSLFRVAAKSKFGRKLMGVLLK